jgi:hypothetical protein
VHGNWTGLAVKEVPDRLRGQGNHRNRQKQFLSYVAKRRDPVIACWKKMGNTSCRSGQMAGSGRAARNKMPDGEARASEVSCLYNQGLARTPQRVNIGQVLEILHGIHKTRRGWVACCPAHDDHSPSLSVAVGDNGRVLLKCWAGCTFQEIVAALGFEPSDLSPGKTRPRTPNECRVAAEQVQEREFERALEAWATQAYIKLTALRRACFLVLDEPNAIDSDLMLYCDHILDELQFGDMTGKLAVMRAARAGKLGLPGTVMMT